MVKPKLSKVAKKLRPNSEDYFDNSVAGPKVKGNPDKRESLRDDSAKPRKQGTNHKTWRQLKDMGTSDSIATRDVHNTQRLERGDMDEIKSGTGMKVLAAMAGILSFVLLWLAWGLVGFGFTFVSDKATDKTYGMDWGAAFDLPPYYQEHEIPPEPGSGLGSGEKCYTPLDEAGNPIGDCVAGEDFVTPEWYDKAVKEQQEAHGLSDKDVAKIEKKHEYVGLGGWLGFRKAGYFRWLLTLAGAAAIWGATRTALLRTVKAQNFMADNTDINQYKNDQHIAVPMEVAERYQVFPDVGAHSPVQVSSMISHVMLSNKGIKNVTRAKRVEADILDEDGEIITHKGEILYDDDGNEVLEELPMFDTDFGHGLYEASGIPKVKRLRQFFNPKEISSNPGGAIFDKFGDADTVADHVNKYWEYPSYEPQRPAGAYIVDEAPVNTMVLAITRAGKGQTYIEPMIDMWLREINHNNMVVNDPKGELLVKHYVRATIRGFKVVQFNLINALKTDIYNPLALAAESAREGDFKACATYVENIGEVFFPVDGADDPVWPNAANNAFKRTAYGIIDYYLEEEREMRKHAMLEDKDLKALETELDQMWGKVTLYNCYQFFVQLSAKKLKDPKVRFQEENKNLSPEEQSAIPDSKFEELEREAELWKGEQEVDMLTLFFNATDALPLNSMRTQVGNADKALRSMGGAEKMLASVYGISITAMSFFTDPTISTLTSGTLSQNTDLGGLSFPRRLGVRFNQDFVRKDSLIGKQVVWSAYEDKNFTKKLEGKDFYHEDIVSRDGWAMYYFKGIFPGRVAYLKLEVLNDGMLMRELYFRFTKGFQNSLSGEQRIKDPITGEKIVLNGLMEELRPRKGKNGTVYTPGHLTFSDKKLMIASMSPEDLTYKGEDAIKPTTVETHAVLQTSVRYSEKPSAVFLVTPPHLMKYAKIILILVKQLVDLNFDKSYMTKSSQKPLYKTRFMLDELGNLQSEGHGISGLETMLSIGLGQEQQFTLILQTLQQLKDVYGDSVDKIVQGNTSNIVFLKSTDDTMIETLSKMSGVRHVSYRDSKTVTSDVKDIITPNESKISYTTSTKEEAVITYNDLAYLPPRNSIVFRAGDPPIWNRNETILPMSFKLFGNTLKHPGHDYTLQNIPTLSSAAEFDVRNNLPNFSTMVSKRMRQATFAQRADDMFRKAYNHTDHTISKLDPDVYSSEVMEIIDALMRVEDYKNDRDSGGKNVVTNDDGSSGHISSVTAAKANGMDESAVENDDLTKEMDQLNKIDSRGKKKIYAGGRISKDDLIDIHAGGEREYLNNEIAQAYDESKEAFKRDENFRVDDQFRLLSREGTLFIDVPKPEDLEKMRELAKQEDSRVYSEGDEAMREERLHAASRYVVKPAFIKFLAGEETWDYICEGAFDEAMARVMQDKEDE